jgi:hypothetical protein
MKTRFNKWTLGLIAVGAVSPASMQNMVKAHEATGHVTMREHVDKMHKAVNKAIQTDERFTTPPPANGAGPSYNSRPYCLDITTPDGDGQHHAIIQTAKGELVRHGFDFDKDEGTCKLVEGDSCPTERTSVYARELERHEAMVKATENILTCRGTSGVKLAASEPWVAGKSVSYIYAPGGVTTISAGFRKNESITACVLVDENTAADLQDSFDFVAATEKQEPYADEDHEAKKATLRFPADKVKFTYGTLRGEEGIIVQGAEPTSYGAEAVNGKVYASWSPEFALDADYAKAKCKKGHWTFPDGVRGSASNPARMVAVSFVTGALTNKPAFKNMPPVKASKVELDADGNPIVPAVDKDAFIAGLDLLNAKSVSEREEFVKAFDPAGACGWLREGLGLPLVQAGSPKGNKNAAGKHGDHAFTMGSKATLGSMIAHDHPSIENHGRAKIGHAEAHTAHNVAAEAYEKEGNKFAAGLHRHNAAFHAQQAADHENQEGRNLAGRLMVHPKHGEVFVAKHEITDGICHIEKLSGGSLGKCKRDELKHVTQSATAAPAAEPPVVKAENAPAPEALAVELDKIYARAFGERQVIDQIASRVPATKTRGDLDKIYSRLGVNG